MYGQEICCILTGVKENGVEIAKNVVDGIFSQTGMLFDFKRWVPALLLETICIALIRYINRYNFSSTIAFLASSNIVPKWVSIITLFVIAAIRTFPSFVYGLMFIRVTGPGPFAGVLTLLAVISIGMISKIFIEAIEDLDTENIRILRCSWM